MYMFQRCCRKSSQTSFLRGVMARGGMAGTPGAENVLLLHPDTGYMGAFILCKPIRQDTHVCASCIHMWHINARLRTAPRVHSQRKSGPRRIPTASGPKWKHQGPLKTKKRGRVPYPRQVTHRDNSMQPPEKEPTSFSNRRNPESLPHHTLVMTDKKKQRQRQNNLLKVRQVVRDKSKCKSWVTSIKTTNYKMVKIFQKEWVVQPPWMGKNSRKDMAVFHFIQLR